MKVECLDFKLSGDEARKLFKSRKRQLKLGQFRFDTGFYLPYYLFRVEILNSGKLTSQLLAIDALTGELDLYGFDQTPTEFVEIETSQIGTIVLSEKQAMAVLKEKARRQIYLQGFFKITDLSITGTMIRLIYIPYWVGFYTRNNRADIEVIDAVRGRFEGGKVRDLVMEWFAQEAHSRQGK